MAAAATAALVDPSFMKERGKLAKNWSGKGGDPAEKYFRKLSLDVVIVIVLVLLSESEYCIFLAWVPCRERSANISLDESS